METTKGKTMDEWQQEQMYGISNWDSDPDYPVSEWKFAVANDDTRLGYAAWVSNQRSFEES